MHGGASRSRGVDDGEHLGHLLRLVEGGFVQAPALERLELRALRRRPWRARGTAPAADDVAHAVAAVHMVADLVEVHGVVRDALAALAHVTAQLRERHLPDPRPRGVVAPAPRPRTTPAMAGPTRPAEDRGRLLLERPWLLDTLCLAARLRTVPSDAVFADAARRRRAQLRHAAAASPTRPQPQPRSAHAQPTTVETAIRSIARSVLTDRLQEVLPRGLEPPAPPADLRAPVRVPLTPWVLAVRKHFACQAML